MGGPSLEPVDQGPSSTGRRGETTTRASGDQRLQTIFEVARLLATEHDLKAMSPRFLSGLIQTLEAVEAGNMLLLDPADGMLEIAAAQGYHAAAMSQIRVAAGEGMSGRAFQTGETCVYATPEAIEEVRANLTPANRELFVTATEGLSQPQSAVGMPLVTGNKKVGALVLESRSRPNAFASEDLPFLSAVADLIALSIENVRLREELQAVQALSEANRLKAELISTLAHEMRTPLTSIKGYSTALLMEEADFDADARREFLNIIDEE